MSIKVSVIIPVYNAEKYITSCIQSLLGQTLQECEFIFTNDGSTDKSRQIIERYKKLDNRIKLINQENQGVSNARNMGLKIATGEYVGFVDADDYIENNMYEILYNSGMKSNCDVVVSNFESEMAGHKIINKYPFPVDDILNREYIEEELFLYFLKFENFNTACNKIYKSKVVKDNNVEFPEKVALGEDGLFNLRFFSHAITMKYIDYTGYHYREVAGSATRSISGKDYFSKALEVFHLELPEIYGTKTAKEKIWQLKSIKLINSVMSYIHIYFTPSQDMSFSKRYKYVKNMITNKYVREALPVYYSESYRTLGSYEKLITSMLKSEFIMGLYCATAYSRIRNK